MNTRKVVLALSVAVTSSAVGQTAPRFVVGTPAECTKRVNDWRTAQLSTAMAALRSAKTADEAREASNLYTALNGAVIKESQRAARECASSFSVDGIALEQVADLASLLAFAGDSIGSRRATERALSNPALSPRQRGQALLQGVAREISSRRSEFFGILEGAERYVAQIDQLPDSVSDIKLAAHERLLAQYEYLDVDDGLRQHATAIIQLGRRTANAGVLAGAFLSLARSAADYLHPDSALKILDAAELEIGSERTAMMFKDFRNRYALIGTRAAPVTGDYWLNTGDSRAPIAPGNGKVTLIEFTAHWCMPCKNSYPGINELAARFRDRPFEGILVTSLYGYIGPRRNLTAPEEVDADREYFTKEHALSFKVAINAAPKDGRGQPRVDQDYRVGGIPQIVIVDKRGVIRQIVIGWDRGNTERIGRLVEALSAER